jgi:hypothetical protein
VRIIKIVILILAIIFIGIQFVRPEKNNGRIDPAKELSAVVSVPPGVDAILRRSCFDCHSNATRYPWYAEVMPAGWFLADHIEEGRARLNFSEYGLGSLRRQYKKLEEISEQINEGDMPLKSYLIMHGDAALTAAEKETLNRWVADSRTAMREKHPEGALEGEKEKEKKAERDAEKGEGEREK